MQPERKPLTANLPRRRGPQSDLYLDTTRAFFPEWSDRTQRTYARAWRLADQLHQVTGQGLMLEAITRATRPGGNLNVSRVSDFIDTRVALFVIDVDNDPDHPHG